MDNTMIKVNADNFDSNTKTTYSSKLTSEMNKKIAVYMEEGGYLAEKIYTFLKREYSVVLVENKKNIHNNPVINIYNVNLVEAFLIYFEVEMFIITSEIFQKIENEEECFKIIDAINSLEKVCKNRGIKLIYAGSDFLFTNNGNNDFLGMEENSIYARCHIKTISVVNSNQSNLLLKFSSFFGHLEYDCLQDFPDTVEENLHKKESGYYDNSVLLYPILSDEIAMYLVDNITNSGIYELYYSENEVTCYEWAKFIANKLNYNMEYCDKYICSKTMKAPLDNNSFKTADNPTAVSITDNSLVISTFQGGYDIKQKQKRCAFHLIYKYSPMDYFFGKRVAQLRISLGRKLAESFSKEDLDKIDYVVPVPKTGLYYAMGLAEAINKPYIQALSKDTSDIRSFQVLDTNVRKEIIRSKVLPIEELIKGKNIILVDEAIFTGTTLKVVCNILNKCGVGDIYLGIPTPECYDQCSYYVQPKRSMLLEYIREDMLEEYFDVSGVKFQNKKNFIETVLSLGNICMECFAGEE